MNSRRSLRILAAGALTLFGACELVVGIKDRPLAQDIDGTTPTRAEAPSEADAVEDTTLQAEVTEENTPNEETATASEDVSSDATPEAEAPADVGAAEAGPCNRTIVPGPPASEDGTQNLTLQLVVKTIDLGIRYGVTQDAAPPFPGYNLDGLLNCPDQPCKTARARVTTCDAGLWCGIDNAALPLFQEFAQLTNSRFHQQQFNDQIAAGTFSILFRIRSYNGGANDQNVEAAMFDSNGTLPGDGGSPAHVTPSWDGSDVWTIDYGSVFGGSGVGAYPNDADTTAYVTNHVLVAHIDHPITLYGGPVLGTIVFDTQGTVITGTLTPNGDGTFRVDDGIIAGRWPTKFIQSGLKALTDPILDGGYLCPNSTSSYSTISKVICLGADITADPRAQSPTTMCDAISFANGFTASAGFMGPVTMRIPPPTTCPESGLENCEY